MNRRPITYTRYAYRWVVLAVFMLLNLMIQVLWIAYAPTTQAAAQFYGVSEVEIGWFAMSFMLIYVLLSIPVSWLLDKFGFYKTVSVAAVVMAIAGVLRGWAGANYAQALLCSVVLGATQPFFMNSWTMMSAKWFPADERTTAVGLLTLSGLLGIAVSMIASPILLEHMPIDRIQWLYGWATVLTAVLFMLLARETPPTPSGKMLAEPLPTWRSIVQLFKTHDFVLVLLLVFVLMGVFNGFTTWIEGVVKLRGYSSTQAGIFGAIVLLAGVIGAIVLSMLSDKARQRKKYLLLCVVLCVPALLGVTFAQSFDGIALSCFALGFFLTGVLPISMQYAVEVTPFASESTSNGIVQLCAQCSVVLVFLMELMRDERGSFTPALLFLTGCVVLSGFCVARMREKM